VFEICGGQSGEVRILLLNHKTVTANYEYRFWAIFWVDASSTASLERGFIDIANKCEIQDRTLDGAKLWLANLNEEWLCIMDNADDRCIDYATYFPSGHKGSILITTRNQDCSAHNTVGQETLDNLDSGDAATLLLKASGVNEDLWEARQSTAKEVVNVLGLHALAIIQAGAFIKKRICSLEEYPREFKVQRHRLLQFRPKQANSTYGDVYATFEVSARVLEESSDQQDSDALEMLKVLAFLHFDRVPELMFIQAWNYAQEIPRHGEDQPSQDITTLSHWHLSRLPGFMRRSSSGKLDVLSLRLTADVLTSFSIITINENHEISMHPLAHAWAKDRLKEPGQKAAWTCTASTLALSIERYGSYQPFWRRLQSHIELCVDLRSDDCFHEMPLEISQVFYRFSWFFCEMRRDSKAISLLTSILEKLGTTFPQGSKNHAIIQELTARCYVNLGHHKRAAKLLVEVIEIQKTMLDPEHPNRLASQHELARAYIGNGQHRRAAELLEEVVEVRKTTLDPEHPDRLASQSELASAYMGNGQHRRAVELLEEVVEIGKTTLDPEHPSRLAPQHELARAYMGNGQHRRAVELLEEVVEIDKTRLDPEHPDRLVSQHALASAYMGNGQHRRAVELLEEVVEIQKTTLEPEHPSRLASQHELARAYIGNGQHRRAAELLEEVVEIRKTTLDLEYPDRLVSQHALARAYMGNGQHRRAAELLEEVVEIDKTTLDPEHPDRLASQHELARVYMANGQHQRAAELLEEVVEIQKTTLDPEHPDRLASQHALARAYMGNGQHRRAAELLEEVVEIDKTTLDPDHPDRLASQYTLARAYMGQRAAPTGGRAVRRGDRG
jgi:tetratricopeptide (TPR) repeat protein